MLILIVGAMIVASPFFAAYLLRRSTNHLKVADRAWGSLENHAHALLQDKTLDPTVGDFVESILLKIGNGSLTRSFLCSLLVTRRIRKAHADPEFRNVIMGLELGQRKQLFRFMIDAIFFDSLRTYISGPILRRLVLYWLDSTARDEQALVSEQQVGPITNAARWAFGSNKTVNC